MQTITVNSTVSTGARPSPRLFTTLALLLLSFARVATAAEAVSREEVLSLLERAGKGETAALESRLAEIEDPAMNALARAQVAAARLDGSGAQQALEDFFSTGYREVEIRALAWEIAATAAFADGDYRRAAAAARERLGLPTDDGEGIAQLYGIAAALAGAPLQSVVDRGPGRVPTHRDVAGLLRTTVTVNGREQEAVIDTGANLSVLSASAARRLGIHLLEGENSVGSATRSAVATRLGLAERLEIAGITLANVAFLVIDDRQLELPLPGGYRIDAIVGFPVLRAMQRITFDAEGGLRAGEPAELRQRAEENLRVIGNSLYITAAVDGKPVSLQLDTGAAQSHLSADFARRHPQLVGGLEHSQQRYAGAGGTSSTPVALWPQVRVSIGERSAILPELPVRLPGGSGDSPGQALLGMDLLNLFDSYTLDFQNRRFELGTLKSGTGTAPSMPAQ